MIAIEKNAWSDEVDDYVITGFEMHTNVGETLIIMKGLNIIAEYAGANESDRKIAKEMREKINERW